MVGLFGLFVLAIFSVRPNTLVWFALLVEIVDLKELSIKSFLLSLGTTFFDVKFVDFGEQRDLAGTILPYYWTISDFNGSLTILVEVIFTLG